MTAQTHPVPPGNGRLVRRLLLLVAGAFALNASAADVSRGEALVKNPPRPTGRRSLLRRPHRFAGGAAVLQKSINMLRLFEGKPTSTAM